MKFFKKWIQKEEREHVFASAVVVAAGSATRMEGKDKILYPLCGVPVIIYSLQIMEASEFVQEIIVVTRQDAIVEIARLCQEYGLSKVSKIVLGGDSRMDSVLLGLKELSGKSDVVAIHDGARPLLPLHVLEETIQRAIISGAAAPAVPVKDTIKIAKWGIVKETLPREFLYVVQTPQTFEPSLIRGALEKALQDGASLTDDCSAVERLGFSVVLTEGSEENLKLTTPGDLLLAKAILDGRQTV